MKIIHGFSLAKVSICKAQLMLVSNTIFSADFSLLPVLALSDDNHEATQL